MIVSGPVKAGTTPNQSSAPDAAVAATRARKTGLIRIAPPSEGHGRRRSEASGRVVIPEVGLLVRPLPAAGVGCERFADALSDSPGWKSAFVPACRCRRRS